MIRVSFLRIRLPLFFGNAGSAVLSQVVVNGLRGHAGDVVEGVAGAGDLVEQIVAATTHVLSTDDSLKEILVSGAAPYFVDQRSLDETVRQIQSRASLYINEQR